MNNELCELNISIDVNLIDEYLKDLKTIMNDNQKIEVFFKKYKGKNEINEYYLINNKWIESKIKNKNDINEDFFPKSNNEGLYYIYPSNFCVVIKDEKNEIIMDTLIKHYKIKRKNNIVHKISVIDVLGEEKYICVIINHVAYFYRIKKSTKEFHLCFYIDFKDNTILEKEIKEKIFQMGLFSYINYMILDNNNNNYPYNLYDIDFKNIGKLFKAKDQTYLFDNNECFNIKLEKDNIYNKIHSLLICFLNIEDMKNYLPKENILDNTLLFSLCQLLRILRKNNQNFLNKINKSLKQKIYDEYENSLDNFLIQLRQLSDKENENIFNDLNILIKLLILQIQKEDYKSENYNKEFNYTDAILPEKNMLDELNIRKTLFEKIFFFKVELSKSCGCRKTYEYKYFLQFDLNDKDNDKVDIYSLLKKMDESTKCDCEKEVIITKKLNNLPKYLILVINSDKKKTLTKFNEIDIKDFSNIKKGTKYELISFINEDFEPFNKSEENKWYKYIYDKDNKYTLPKSIKYPNLLIYKQLNN